MFFKAIIWLKVLLNVGGCGGQPLSSKSILKVKKQMAAPKEHAHAPFLTQMTVLVGNLKSTHSKEYSIGHKKNYNILLKNCGKCQKTQMFRCFCLFCVGI